MKFKFYENESCAWFDLEPETAAETAQCLRVAANTNSEKPSVYMNFSGNAPELTVCIKKIKKSVQVNSISPNKVKR